MFRIIADLPAKRAVQKSEDNVGLPGIDGMSFLGKPNVKIEYSPAQQGKGDSSQ